MEDNSTINRDNGGSSSNCTPIQYDVGEVCKCYYTEISKNVDSKVSQQINKCQSFCRITEKNPNDVKEYTVVLFDKNRTVKKLPGRCLRKVKLLPYTYEQAINEIGRVIESTESFTDGTVSMIVASVEKESVADTVTVNTIEVGDLMKDFRFKDNGAPCCNIVMLKADEAFSDNSTAE